METMKKSIQKQNFFLYFTVPIVFLMLLCSGTGLLQPGIYSRETPDWLAQCMGQDISNIFAVMPILLISAIFSAKGSRASQVIWAGTMITNIYSFMLYCFAVHFNGLFHFYCIILGLSVYAMIYFSAKYYGSDFGAWYKSEPFGKATGIFLLVTAGMFYFLWLSQSLPAALSGSLPEAVAADALLTNPVHVLDYSFYLPLIVISGITLLRRNRIGYFLAPMMLVFELLTDVNIISLSVVTMVRLGTDSLVLVCGFTAFAVITLCILIRFLKRIKTE